METLMNKNGGARRLLPPGFRFRPTDEELVVQYLKRKVMCCPLPTSIIPEFDVYKSDPWDFLISSPGDEEQERYFFCNREVKYPNGSRSKRATRSGYWKVSGSDNKQILSSRSNHVVVGVKKTLVFYTGKPSKGCSSRTDWIMHEYSLGQQTQASPETKNWVLCRMFLKKRRRCNKDNGAPQNMAPIFYLLEKERTDSSSSGITEVSTRNKPVDNGDDESSSCNSFIANIRSSKQGP